MNECSTDPPHQTLRLKVVLRPKTTTGRYDDVTDVTNIHSNHFVRLSLNSAQRLSDIALSIVRTTPPVINQKHPSSTSRRWWIHHQCSYNISPVMVSNEYNSGIEFLPLAITLESTGEIIYASYNGGNLSIDKVDYQNNNTHLLPNGEDADSFIDIPECLLTGWTNRDGMDNDMINSCFVAVQPLTYIDSASTLFVDPVTSDDWDVLQSNAAELEDGRLLQQISIVYSGQVIQLIMSNGTKANLVVTPRNFERNMKSLWPMDAATTRVKCPCYRLLEDTEFIITPKPRPSMHPIQYPLQLIPTRQDYELFDRAMIQLSEQIHIELVSVQQGSIVIHPNTLARIQSDCSITTASTQCRDPLFAAIQVTSATSLLRKDANNDIKNSPSDDVNISVAVQIIVSKTIPEDHAALHPFVRIRINGSIFTGRTFVSVKKFLAPIEITKLSTMIPDLVEAGEATVQFKRVQLCIPRTLSPWCSPMERNTGDTNYIDPSNHNDRQTKPTHNSVFHFGSMCWLPERGTSLYRLDLRINDRLRDFDDVFLFTKQLLELSDRVKFDEVKEIFTVGDTTSSRLLSRTLPRHPICLSSPMLKIAESALLRSSVLLYGDSGCGKTFTSLLIASVARLVRGDKCVYLGCKHLRDSDTIRMKTMLTELEDTFNVAYEVAPCVVILDDLDAIAPSFQSSDQADNSALSLDINPTEIDQSKLVSNVLRHLMRAKEQRVFVVATTSSTQSLSQLISSKGIFNHQVAVPALNDNDREIIYRSFLHQSTDEASWSKDANFVRQTSGFRPRDLEILAFRTTKYQSIHSRKINLHEATSKALEDYIPLSRLTSNIEDKLEQTYKFCDIGGLSQPKADLISTIVRPSMYRRIYSNARIRLPRGVLLFGFPGTGKSMCIPALAHECGYPLITCRGPELLDKYIGASEAKIRALFARAAASAPSILFLDELDALAPRRGSDHTGVTDRIVNQLLTFLDGVEDVADSVTGRTVYVIGATSRPDKVDPALLRPGRLEKHIYFGLSDDMKDIKNLLSKISESYTLDEKAITAILAGTFVEEMSTLHQSFRLFSAADFTSMFNVAQLMAVRTALDVGRTNSAAEITYHNLCDAMMSARPSLSQQDYDRLLGIYMSYRQGQVKPPEKHIQPMLTALR